MEFSRARFLVASSLGMGAALALDRIAARAGDATQGDVRSLNAAVELERAAIKAYDDAAATKLLPTKTLDLALLFKRDHETHLAALSAALVAGGATPSSRVAKIAYPRLASAGDIATFAMKTEQLAASTYLSMIPELDDRELSSLIASILGVETVHVGIFASALDAFPPYPGGLVT